MGQNSGIVAYENSSAKRIELGLVKRVPNTKFFPDFSRMVDTQKSLQSKKSFFTFFYHLFFYADVLPNKIILHHCLINSFQI